MALVKIDALFREFRFLEDHLKKDDISDFKVQRMDVDLLNAAVDVEWVRSYKYGEIDRLTSECLILDRKGKLLLRVGSFDAPVGATIKVTDYIDVDEVWYKPQTWRGWGFPKIVISEEPLKVIYKSELVKNAFFRLGERINEAAFVIYWKPDSLPRTLYIYKAPRGKTISEWIDQEIETVRAEIAEEFQAL